MEILMLVLLYYLSQNPDFHESVKPLMGQLKNSEQMLSFLNDLSKFSQTFSSFQNQKPKENSQGERSAKEEKQEKRETDKKNENKDEKEPRSPTAGIADDFIQQILDGYLKNR